MGSAAGWISVAGLGKDEVLARLGLEETGEALNLTDEWFDGYTEAGVAILPSGRVLVIADAQLCATETAAEVSVGCDLVWVESASVASYVRTVAFRDGREVWSVERNPDLPELFSATGELPTEVLAIIPSPAGDAYDAALQVPGMIGRYDPDEDIDGFDGQLWLLRADGTRARRLDAERRRAAEQRAAAMRRQAAERRRAAQRRPKLSQRTEDGSPARPEPMATERRIGWWPRALATIYNGIMTTLRIVVIFCAVVSGALALWKCAFS